ncbi:hypothetical protein SG34_030425 [Thalassomonas viridans]|uniref:Secreted protein n=1 Tax=Thalassomonas viridans TaxID=137584 RepID=A0AAF0CF71_9GAMM|nr:hypothetical protein [Thalassomonas viridans]WDE09089.1 hypothetical protein SG34_030425 [Thalassomonas viridans]
MKVLKTLALGLLFSAACGVTQAETWVSNSSSQQGFYSPGNQLVWGWSWPAFICKDRYNIIGMGSTYNGFQCNVPYDNVIYPQNSYHVLHASFGDNFRWVRYDAFNVYNYVRTYRHDGYEMIPCQPAGSSEHNITIGYLFVDHNKCYYQSGSRVDSTTNYLVLAK